MVLAGHEIKLRFQVVFCFRYSRDRRILIRSQVAVPLNMPGDIRAERMFKPRKHAFRVVAAVTVWKISQEFMWSLFLMRLRKPKTELCVGINAVSSLCVEFAAALKIMRDEMLPVQSVLRALTVLVSG